MGKQLPVQPKPKPVIQPENKESLVSNQTLDPQAKSKTWLIAVLLFLFLGASGVTGYFAYQNYQLKLKLAQVSNTKQPVPDATAVVNPSPTVSPNIEGVNFFSDWKIEVRFKSVYTLEDFCDLTLPPPVPDPSAIPVAGGFSGIAVKLVTPINTSLISEREWYCTYYEDEREAILERKIGDQWETADICPVQEIKSNNSQLYCREPLPGTVFVPIVATPDCPKTVDPGIYRVKYIVFANCQMEDYEAPEFRNKKANSNNCTLKKEILSPDIPVKLTRGPETNDYGKRCTDNSQCEGTCLTFESDKVGESTAGHCSQYQITYGCYSSVSQGKVMPTICID